MSRSLTDTPTPADLDPEQNVPGDEINLLMQRGTEQIGIMKSALQRGSL